MIQRPDTPIMFLSVVSDEDNVRYLLNNSSSETFSVLLIVGKKEWKMEKKI